ncbi:MAG: hypothetical protein D6683_07590, partial [Actinomyces sp.]
MSPRHAARPAWCEIDLDAIAHNTRLLAERAAGAALCAVVKADAYGHGVVPVATTAVASGARWLAVATLDEAATLVEAGVGGDVPVLVLSEPEPSAVAELVAELGEDADTLVGRVRPTVTSPEAVAVL